MHTLRSRDFYIVLAFLLFIQSSIFGQRLNINKFLLKAKIRYTGNRVIVHTLNANLFTFFDIRQNDIILSYFNQSGKIKSKVGSSINTVINSIMNANQIFNLFVLSDQSFLLQRYLLQEPKKTTGSTPYGVPTEFVVIDNGKIKNYSQVKGTVVLLPILRSSSIHFNAVGNWNTNASLKPFFKVNQSGKVIQTIQIKNKTPRKSYHVYSLNFIAPLPREQYIVLHQYNKDRRCLRTYLDFSLLDIPARIFSRANLTDLCKKPVQIKQANSNHKIIYSQSAQVKGLKYDRNTHKLVVLVSKKIISKTEKLRRKHTNTSYLFILSRKAEKLYSTISLPEKFNNAQLIGFSKNVVYLGIAKKPYYSLYSTTVAKSIGNTK